MNIIADHVWREIELRAINLDFMKFMIVWIFVVINVFQIISETLICTDYFVFSIYESTNIFRFHV